MNSNCVIKGLECCIEDGWESCHNCPYYCGNCHECTTKMKSDALEYIHRSEEAREMLVEKCDEMLQTLKDLPDVVRCSECKYADEYFHCRQVNFWATENDYCSRGARKDSE